MAKDINKIKRKYKKSENNAYLISYFEDLYNSFSDTRSYYVKTKRITADSKLEAYSRFLDLYGYKGIVNIISLDD